MVNGRRARAHGPPLGRAIEERQQREKPDGQARNDQRRHRLERARESTSAAGTATGSTTRAAGRSSRRPDWPSRRAARGTSIANASSDANTAAITTVSFITCQGKNDVAAVRCCGWSGPEMPCRRISDDVRDHEQRPARPAAGTRARRTSGPASARRARGRRAARWR